MATEMGEYLVGAYLQLEQQCDVVSFNVRPPGGGLKGLQELDVVGLNFKTNTAYLCEVATHIRGLGYGNYEVSARRVEGKYQRQREYAKTYLQNFQQHHFMLWSPIVPKGPLTEALAGIEGLELIINGAYRDCVDQLRQRAKAERNDTGNPFFRSLQILECLRK